MKIRVKLYVTEKKTCEIANFKYMVAFIKIDRREKKRLLNKGENTHSFWLHVNRHTGFVYNICIRFIVICSLCLSK